MINLKSHSYRSNRKSKKKFAVLVLAGVLVALGIAIFIVFGSKPSSGNIETGSEKDLSELWNAKNYDDIIVLAEKKLQTDPLNHFYLTFKGISYFYKAKSEPEKKELYLNKAIFSLRKAELVSKERYAGEINYILGLSYFLKGKYYFDYAAKFMEASLHFGYKGVDTYKCLGLAYGGMDMPDKELEYFLLALKEEESGPSLLAVGEAYMKKNDEIKAEEYILRALNKTNDNAIVEECRTKLGDIYMGRKNYLAAEEQYNQILKIDPQSTNAFFNLGEIYYELKDIVKARSYWREVLKIDPSHYGAKLRYYK
jgi:tetratricopeptide (TPR) repeat protein